MEITIKGAQEEIQKMLQAIVSSKEQKVRLEIDSKVVTDSVVEAIHDKLRPY